jgi:hypothetical protein
LEVFALTSQVDNIQGLYILTDGMPNHMCPKQGFALCPDSPAQITS